VKLVSIIRKIEEEEITEFTRLQSNAYPTFMACDDESMRKHVEKLTEAMEKNEYMTPYGIYRDEKLVGGMKFYDFNMNFRSNLIKVGGLGSVAVNLINKKEHVAKEILKYFMKHYSDNGCNIVTLYPFRPDFYKRMGFGYGTKVNQFRVKPESLPKGTSKKNIVYLDESNSMQILECYNKVASNIHGMIEKCLFMVQNVFKDPNSKTIGYMKDSKLFGYITFKFKKESSDNPFIYDIHLDEIIYENNEVYNELLTFLHTQLDQARYIIYNTQEENFHYLLSDPRYLPETNMYPLSHESNLQGVGIMYRVVNIENLFNNNKGSFGKQDCTIKINITDSFFNENNRSVVVSFKNGMCEVCDNSFEVEISLDISDFSSMVMGVIGFKKLIKFGLATISDEKYLDNVNGIFIFDEKPICTVTF